LKKHSLVSILLFFALCIIFHPISTEGKEFTIDFHREFDVVENPSLYVDNLSGEIRIKSHSKNKIIIKASKVVKAKNLERAEKVAEDTKIKTRKRDSEVIIRTQYPRFRLFQDEKVKVYYHILVPEKTKLDLKTTSANVDIEGIRENINVSTTSGDITIEEAFGEIVTSCTSGDVIFWDISGKIRIKGTSSDIELSKIEGDLRIECTSGDVEIDNLEGEAEISVTSGDITLQEIDGNIEATSASGDVDILQKKGSLDLESISGTIKAKTKVTEDHRYSLETLSGDVYLYIQKDADAKVKLETSSGTIHSKVSLTLDSFSRKLLVGEMGNGESEINIFTTSGDITIKEY